MKKTLSLLTALAMLLVLMPTFAIAEEAAEEPIVITAFMDGDPTLDYSQNYSLQYLEEIFVHHIVYQPAGRLLVMAYGRRNLGELHRVPHGKEDGLYDPL